MGNSELGSNKTCCLSIGRSLRGSCSCCIDRSIRLAEVATSTQSCHCCRQAWSHSFERLKLTLYLLVTFTLMNDPVALSVKENVVLEMKMEQFILQVVVLETISLLDGTPNTLLATKTRRNGRSSAQ